MNKLFLFLLNIAFFATIYPMQLPQQIHSPSSVLHDLVRDYHLRGNVNMDRNEKLRLFVNDCNASVGQNDRIPQHQANDESIRIVTYNVHYWTDPFGRPNFDAICRVIEQVNADVLILQEVSWGPTAHNQQRTRDQIKQAFTRLGYEYFLFGQAANLFGAPFGNVIISKYPFFKIEQATIFQERPANIAENRSFVKVSIDLPNNKSMTVYGTHLDVFDETGAWRENQTNQLIQHINDFQQNEPREFDENRNGYIENVLIAADFNEPRAVDYRAFALEGGMRPWNLIIVENRARTGVQDMPTAVARLLAEAHFQDCFTRAQYPRWPLFTVWSGTAVDFIYLAQTWRLPIIGCYMYYNAASDHLPIIMDVDVR